MFNRFSHVSVQLKTKVSKIWSCCTFMILALTVAITICFLQVFVLVLEQKKLLVKQVVVTQLRQIKAVFSYGLLNLIAVWLMLNQPEMLRCSCIAEKPLLAARQAGSAVGTD